MSDLSDEPIRGNTPGLFSAPGAGTAAPGSLVANARMYSMTPLARQAWKTLLTGVMKQAGLDWPVIDYDPPRPLSELWARPALGCVQMCGLPFGRARLLEPGRLRAVVAPVVSLPAYGDRPVYWSYLMVRSHSPYRSIEDTYGGVIGYNSVDSQSGYIALRKTLQTHARKLGGPPWRAAIGGLVTHGRSLQALASGAVDLVAIDSYLFDLLSLHAPGFTRQFRSIGHTDVTPNPLFVASGTVAPSDLRSLRDALMSWPQEPANQKLREQLLIERFVIPETAPYDALALEAQAIETEPLPWAQEIARTR